MPQQQTIQSFLTYWPETAWNQTPVGPSAIRIPVASETLKAQRTYRRADHYRGAYERGKPFPEPLAVGGDLTVNLNPLAHAFLLKELLTANPVTVGTNPYTHTLTPGAQTVGFGMERKVGSEYFVYSGLRVVRAQLRARGTGPMEAVFTVIGGGESVNTSPVDSAPTDYADDPFELSGSGIQIFEGGSPIANVAEVEITIDREGEAGEPVVGGQGKPSGVLTGFVTISGRVRALYYDKSLYDKAAAGTETSLRLLMSRGAGTGALGEEQMEIVLPEIVLEPDAPTIQTAKGHVVEHAFHGFYHDAAEGAGIQVVVKNTIPTL